MEIRKQFFVTAMDSTPLSPDPVTILQGRDEDFVAGLHAVSKLTDGKTFVCKAPGAAIATGDAPVEVHEFGGKHPAGTVGVHITRSIPSIGIAVCGILATKTSRRLDTSSIPVDSM